MLFAVGIYILVCPQCQTNNVGLPSCAATLNTSDFIPRTKQLPTTMCTVEWLFDCGHRKNERKLCREGGCGSPAGWEQHRPGKCGELEPARLTPSIEGVHLCHRAGLHNAVFDTREALCVWEGSATRWLQ